MDKQFIVVVCGPTASGKTALSVELAKRLSGEIISADSMQIYRGMNIATAKPTDEEKQGIPHYLMDFLDPHDSFSVADYVKAAHGIIADIAARGKLPIITGGTGLYISSLIDNLSFEETECATHTVTNCVSWRRKRATAFCSECSVKLIPKRRISFTRTISTG